MKRPTLLALSFVITGLIIVGTVPFANAVVSESSSPKLDALLEYLRATFFQPRSSALTAQLIATPAPEFPVYRDGAVSPWTNGSFGGTFTIESTERAFLGAKAVKANTNPWGAVSFLTRGESVGAYQYVEFSVYPIGGDEEFSVLFQTTSGVSPLVFRTAPGSRWTTITIPLSEFGIPGSALVTRMYVSGGAVAREWYLDQVRFLGTPVISGPTRDAMPPTVSIVSPAAGFVASGTVPVVASATDASGVTGVQFRLDGVGVGNEVTGAPFTYRWNAASSSEGYHTVSAVARDAAGNTRISSDVRIEVRNPPRDIQAPTVSIVFPGNKTSISGDIPFEVRATDNIGVTKVEFMVNGKVIGTKNAAPFVYVWNTSSASGTPVFSAKAYDAAGNSSLAPSVSASVLVDTEKPFIEITAPLVYRAASGTVTVSATSSDNVKVAGVQFKLDGTNLGAEDTAAPYSTQWNTTLTVNGQHVLTAVARDAAGNRTTSNPVTIETANPTSGPDLGAPLVALTAPRPNLTTSSESIVISATSSDDIGVFGVQFKLNGNNFGLEDTTSPYSIIWDTSVSIPGTYTLTAVARDRVGNRTISGPGTVYLQRYTRTPDTGAPSASVSFPKSGTFATGTVVVTATASDNVKVAGVQFKLDGTNLGAEDTAAPYSTGWNTTLTVNGQHVLTAVARDAAGNRTASIGASVLVANAVVAPSTTSTDRTAPSVSIATPFSGVTVRGTSTVVTVRAADAVGIAGVRVKIDGTDIGPEKVGTSTIVFVWNTMLSNDGAHILTAVARDAAGNTRTANPVSVIVANPLPIPDTTAPTVFITVPRGNASILGTTTIVVAASDNISIAGVQFKLDGTNFGAEVTAAPFSLVWDTTVSASGMHVITAVARDSAGNTAVSNPISVLVTNAPPVPDKIMPRISLSAPTSRAVVSGKSVSVTATASDNVKVAGVQFKLDGTNLGVEDTAAPYSLNWDTTATANGQHVLSATVRDTGGNSKTSDPIFVEVKN
jgi:YD repeat-containing protein